MPGGTVLPSWAARGASSHGGSPRLSVGGTKLPSWTVATSSSQLSDTKLPSWSATSVKLPTLQSVLANPPKKPSSSGGGGVLGFAENFGSDLKSFVGGLPGGVEQVGKIPVDVAKGLYFTATGNEKAAVREQQAGWSQVKAIGQTIAKQYATTYGPLAHGDVNGFLHQLYAHPLGPILDLATLVTGGGSALAKAGMVTAKGAEAARAAGLISDTGRVARAAKAAGELGKAKDLTVPDFSGEGRLVLRKTSANPAVALRERATNAALNKLPAETPILGSDARAARIIKRGADLNANRLQAKLVPFSKAYSRLNAEKQAAFHMVANGLDPDSYAGHLAALKAEGHQVAEGTFKTLANPTVRRLVADIQEAPDGRIVSASGKNVDLVRALNEGRKASDLLTNEKLRLGLIPETAAAERPYAALRLVNGAKYDDAATLESLHGRALAKAARNAEHGESSTATPTPEEKTVLVYHATTPEIAERINREVRMVSNSKRIYVSSRRADADYEGAVVPLLVPERLLQLVHEFPTGEKRYTILAHEIRRPHILPGATEGPTVAREGGGVVKTAAGSRAERLGGKLVDAQGRDIETLARELHEQGKPQPFYMPMRAEENSAWRNGRSLKVATNPATVAASTTKRLRGVLLNQGLLSFHDSLSPEFLKTVRYGRRADLHDALMEHAIRLAPDATLPHGWTFLKTKTGEHIGYTERIRGEFEHNLRAKEPFDFKGLFTTRDALAPEIASDELGGRLIVPNRAVKDLADEIRASGPLKRLLYSKPTTVWKHLVLGLRPGFGVNLTVGNHLLAMLQSPSMFRFFDAYLRQLPKGKLAGLLGGKLDAETLEHVFPEQAHGGAFGSAEGFGMKRGLRKAAQGVMPATIGIENFLRAALTEAWARATPEVKAALRQNGGDINAAVREVADKHPDIRQEISRRVDDALGNYRSYSHAEQIVRDLIPFYGWDRHIVRSSRRILAEFPHRANVLQKLGTVGAQRQASTLGPLPSYLGGALLLGHVPGLGALEPGRVPVLDTHTLNPFNTDAELAQLVANMVHGHAGSAGASGLLDSINPLIQAAIEQATGRDLLTGQQVKGGPNLGLLGNTAANTFGNVPQLPLLKAAIGAALGHKQKPTPANKLYQKDLRTLILDFLGAPVKKVNRSIANADAAKGY